MGQIKNIKLHIVTDIKIEKQYGYCCYVSSISSNLMTKKHQQKVEMVLTGKKIPFEFADVASDESAKIRMKELCGDKSKTPLIVNGDVFCGDFEAFEEAVEYEELDTFLKL